MLEGEGREKGCVYVCVYTLNPSLIHVFFAENGEIIVNFANWKCMWVGELSGIESHTSLYKMGAEGDGWALLLTMKLPRIIYAHSFIKAQKVDISVVYLCFPLYYNYTI